MTEPTISQQELIEVIPFEGFLLFGKIPVSWREQFVPFIAGFSQEVYHENSYLGSVSSLSSRPVKAHRGDVIYRISLGTRPVSFTGTIATTDGYRRDYEVNVDLVVRDAKRSVEQYRSGADIISYAVNMLRNGIEKTLQQHAHDQIDRLKLSIESYNTILKNEYGLVFVNLKWGIQDDSRRISEREAQQRVDQRRREIEARTHELKQQAYLRKTELLINADVKNHEENLKRDQESVQKQHERTEKACQNAFSREEKMKSQLNEARIRLLNKTVDDLIRINSERMQDAFDSNVSARRVLEDSLRLIGVFDKPVDEDINVDVINSSLAELDNPVILGAEGGTPETEEIETDTPEV